MVLGAVTVFFASLVGIIGLFSLKLWEERQGHAFSPSLRFAGDALALKCKNLLLRGEELLARLPSLTMYIAMTLLASGAVGFARVARAAAEAAHGLADFVSHKHNFERRETRSDFLKQVSEHHKNGNGGAPASPLSPSVSAERVVPLPQASRRKKLTQDVDVRR